MNGCILHGVPIAVDCFQQKTIGQVKYYFLSHMHADHTVGLSSKWSQPIYCSRVTGRLLYHKFSIPAHLIEILEPSQPHLLSHKDLKLTVHMLEANHCAGSSMFFFETEKQKILYTGDFRFDKGIPTSFETLYNRLKPINKLYLDNTYCEPSCVFPSRDQAVNMIIDICKQHPKHRVYVGTSWVGHEELLVQLSVSLKEYVFVDSDFFSRLQLLEVADVFKIGSSCRLNAIPNSRLTCSSIKELNEEMPTIGIKPTAMFGGQCTTFDESAGLIHCVPYSNHCNFVELTEFVKLVAPAHIKPIVPGRKSKSGMESLFRADMRQFEHFLTVFSENADSENGRFNLKSETTLPKNPQSVSNKRHKVKAKNRIVHPKAKPYCRGVNFISEHDKDTKIKTNVKKSAKESIQTEIEDEIIRNCQQLFQDTFIEEKS